MTCFRDPEPYFTVVGSEIAEVVNIHLPEDDGASGREMYPGYADSLAKGRATQTADMETRIEAYRQLTRGLSKKAARRRMGIGFSSASKYERMLRAREREAT
jgi:hypothetical protein